MNSLYQSLNQQNQALSQNKQVTVQDILKEVQQSGKSPQELFYAKAQALGVNPMDILNKASAMMTNQR